MKLGSSNTQSFFCFTQPIKEMAEKLEIFVIFRKHLAMCGIIEPLNSHSLNFNFKNFTIIFFSILLSISTFKFLNEANTFEEYTDGAATLIYTTVFIIFYLIVVWRTSILFGSLNKLEIIINKSKLIYT